MTAAFLLAPPKAALAAVYCAVVRTREWELFVHGAHGRKRAAHRGRPIASMFCETNGFLNLQCFVCLDVWRCCVRVA